MNAQTPDLEYLNDQDSTIGALLDAPELILTLPIESRWFTRGREIVDAMLKLAADGISIDVFSLSKLVSKRSVEHLIAVKKNCLGTKANYGIYLENVRKQFEARAARQVIAQTLAEIDHGTQATVALDGLVTKAMSIASADFRKYNYTMTEGAQMFTDHLTLVHEAKVKGQDIGLRTGIATLDNVMGNMHSPDLVVVGARPSVGKTAASISILRNIAKQGKRVGFISTEMPIVQVMNRMYSIESGIASHKIRYANLDDRDWVKLEAASRAVADLKIEICDKPSITVEEIAMQARSWTAKEKLDFIAIDYLTRIKISKSLGSQNLDIGYIITELKNLARTLEIPVMVLAQLHRGPNPDVRPNMSNLRDSGVIEQEGDTILLLHRPREEDPEIIVDKNRHGPCGIVRCAFIPETMHWRDFDDSWQ